MGSLPRHLCAAAQLTWGGGRRKDLLSPRYHPYPPPVPGRHCSSASRWQCLVLELSTTLVGPSWGGQVSEQMPGPRHVSRTCQPVEQSWKVPGPFPVLGPQPKGGAQGHRKDRWMSLKLLLAFHPENGKGKLTLAKRETCFSVFFLSNLICMFQRREARGVKPRCVGGKGSKMAWVCP